MRSYILFVVTFWASVCCTSVADAQCSTPTLSVFDISGDSATLSWSSVGAVLNYEYAVIPASSPQPTSGTTTTALSVRVGGLQPGKGYKAWLKANCTASISSNWTSITFSTSCGTPSTIGVSNVKADSADITWTAIGPGINYQYHVDTFNTTPSGGTNISTNNVRVKGLLPGKTYYVFVRTDCGTSVYSPWSSYQSFFTPYPVAINTMIAEQENIKAYPNPVTNILTVQIPNSTERTNITIFNAFGKAVSSFSNTGNTLRVDMSEYPAGVYTVRINNNKHIETIKVLKR